MLNWQRTLISEYANSPILTSLLNNFNEYMDPTANIDNFYNLIWNIATAQGYGLDVWGRIVGVQRILTVNSGTYFGFAEANDSTFEFPFNQQPFYSGQNTTGNFALTDPAFQTLIYAKALVNISDGSIPSTNNILMTLFGATNPVHVIDNHNMTITFAFTSTLSPVDAAIVENSGVFSPPNGNTLIITS